MVYGMDYHGVCMESVLLQLKQIGICRYTYVFKCVCSCDVYTGVCMAGKDYTVTSASLTQDVSMGLA